MFTQVPPEGLTPVEQSLVEHVRRGAWLDLAADDEVTDETSMRSWGDSRICRATVIRDILRGRLAPDPDPHGLGLRGARITGRLDLEKLTTDVSLGLTDCFLEEGLLAQDARLAFVNLTGCLLEHPAEPPLDAARLTCSGLDLGKATIIGHARPGGVLLSGARTGTLSCEGATLRNDSGPALMAEDLEADQGIDLTHGFSATGTGQLPAVSLVGVRTGGALNCYRATLRNDSGPALAGDFMQVAQAVWFAEVTVTGASQLGAVFLFGAHIGGILSCVGASLRNDSGPALAAQSLQADQDILLTGGFSAVGAGEAGAVRLVGTHIGGALDCSGASLRNDSGPALASSSLRVGQDMRLTGGFSAIGTGDGVAVDLTDVRVGGTLKIEPVGLEHTADSQGRLAVDGLTYAGVPEPISAGECLRLLREGTRSYAAQPYQQLAAGYRALGHEGETRRILMAQRDDQLARTKPRWSERCWGKITMVTLGYGYQPWRALLFLTGVVALSCVLAVALGSHGALVQTSETATPGRPCTVIQQVSVGLDLNLPVGTSVAREQCDLAKDSASTAAAWLIAAGWVLRLLAWVFAVLFIAGFTSAVRKA